MNPMQMLQKLKSNNANIKEIAHEYGKQLNNPIINNLITQLDNGNQEEANKIITNIMEQNGMGERFQQFVQSFSTKNKN